MRKIMFATILTVLMAFSTSFAAENVNSPPIISVNGDGFVEMTPDRAKISVGVVTNAKNPSEAQNLNAQAAKSVINSIIRLGIERKNVSTGN
ncbi:MAG: SIMPL domain-containing protein, partial [Selenomonadaceae bacterium]|nr:SIMPL domain-containing protein [Selenomonadaceae bacterium]